MICANREHELVFIAKHGNIKSGIRLLFLDIQICWLFNEWHASSIQNVPNTKKYTNIEKRKVNRKWKINFFKNFSNLLLERIIYHKICICNLCGLHELCGCVSLDIVLEKMFYYKIHNCNLCIHCELYGGASRNLLMKWIFVAFMNSFDMNPQMSCLRKWFATKFTFVIFLFFVNSKNVIL